jgi:hypothetical protein
VQTKPLAIYVGATCFLVAGIAGGAWAMLGRNNTETPLFLQAAAIPTPVPVVNWPPPSRNGSIAFLDEWVSLVTPHAPIVARSSSTETEPADASATAPAASKNAAATPHEVIRETTGNEKSAKEEAAKEKRSKKKAAKSEKRRRAIEMQDDGGEQDRTVGLGSTPRAAEHDDEDRDDRKSFRHWRDRERHHRRAHNDRDVTVGERMEHQRPQVRAVPAERGGGLFGLFGGFDDGW